jgi:methyl-accepting chemotaxis protein
MDMDKESPSEPKRHQRQRYFVARETLLGGIFLQSVSSALISYFGFKTPSLGIFLVLGYIGIVVLLAILFSHRLVGPFKRLEYEMNQIRAGEISKRLSLRSKDDLHVRNFVENVNDFVHNFEEMSREYSRLNSAISTSLGDIVNKLSEEGCDRDKIIKELKSLLAEIHMFREKW